MRSSWPSCVNRRRPGRPASDAGDAATEQVLAALEPWQAERTFLNFAERPVDASGAFDEATWRRLVEVKRQVDPEGLFLGNHQVN